MLAYNEITEKKYIIYEKEPCEVMESHVARTQQRKPQNQVKLKSLLSGRTWTTTFHTSDKAEEADISKKDIKYLYSKRDENWFCDPNNPKDRFMLTDSLIGDSKKFFKENTLVNALIFENSDGEEQIIKIQLPVKMIFEITDAPPSIKGNTSSGGSKVVTLETGATVNTPLFIDVGEKIIVNTETGQYVERAPKE